MVKKLQQPGPAKAHGAQLADAVRDSAQQIWQAGLGAFAKAQAEGSKAFNALVKEGTALQRKTQAVAEEKISEASSRMGSMATDISVKASGQWDKLESIFEDRVSKALHKLDVPSAKDLNALTARIEALAKAVDALSTKARPAAKAARKPAAKPIPKAPIRRRAKAATV